MVPAAAADDGAPLFAPAEGLAATVSPTVRGARGPASWWPSANECFQVPTSVPISKQRPGAMSSSATVRDSKFPISETDVPLLHETAESAEVYQSVSRSAVASLLLGLFGLLAFAWAPLLLFPLLGVFFALLAWRGFRKFPDELLGRPVAWAGGILSLLSLLGAPPYHAYVYATEVPEGYTRVSFEVLKSGYNQPDQPTEAAMELDGQKIFIKGYIHPNSMDALQSRKFVIVPDLGTCCFGKQPPLTHMIEVTLTGEQYATKSFRKQRLAGTLHVNKNLKPVDGLTGVYYQLRADLIK